jgi:hypothetical protein
MTKATYTEDNFEEYYRNLVEEYCRKEGMPFRLDEWDGARENMRDDAFEYDEEGNDTGIIAYEDEDLIDEYLYFCLTADLDGFLETSDWADNFDRKYLAPVHDDQEMIYEFFAYREGDKPYSHYDTGRMDLYRGTYTFIKEDGIFVFEPPVKINLIPNDEA